MGFSFSITTINIRMKYIEIIKESIKRVPRGVSEMETLGNLMEKPLPVGMAVILIPEIIDDDTLTDEMRSMEENDPSRDARPLIISWVKNNLPHMLITPASDGQGSVLGNTPE
jgi:hypothetical protein